MQHTTRANAEADAEAYGVLGRISDLSSRRSLWRAQARRWDAETYGVLGRIPGPSTRSELNGQRGIFVKGVRTARHHASDHPGGSGGDTQPQESASPKTPRMREA